MSAARRRAPIATVAEVEVWGRRVGALAEALDGGAITFRYDDRFVSGGLELSPFHLPLRAGQVYSFPELRRTTAFAGLPGLFADALPDAFGNAVIQRYFAQQGRPDAALSPLQRLLYIGRRGMGALEFTPPVLEAQTDAVQEALHLETLVTQARAVVAGDTTSALREIMQIGASAGGARAKALVLWNPATAQMRSGAATARDGEEHWLIKFDGVSGGVGGHALDAAPTPGPYGRIEAVYAELARLAGIDMAPTHLFLDGELAHFGTRRFDRTAAGERVHIHTLGGLRHVDFNESGAYSYEGWFDTLRSLRLPQTALTEAMRRVAFTVASRNQDDHVKNMACRMTADGVWSLAPAYDVTWSMGSPWTSQHQMSVRGKRTDITGADLAALADTYDVPHAQAILADVDAALSEWPTRAGAVGLAPELVAAMATQFRRLAPVTRAT